VRPSVFPEDLMYRVQTNKALMILSISRRCLPLFSIVLLCVNVSAQFSATTVDSTIMHLADPTIFHYGKTYYLYGTVEGAAGNGFLVYTSSNLKSWKLYRKNNGYALKKGDAFGTSGFWAPQVFHYNNKFYMAYVANENIAVAESDSPAGPFRQKQIKPLPAPIKQIDPFVFIDDDRKKYIMCD
jgi:xylan 1,4-beta-xylosidase